MKHYVQAALGILFLAIVLAGCPTPYVLGTTDLKSQTLTYYAPDFLSMAADGHSNITVVFDSTGKAGTYEMQDFSLSYATAAAVGDYSKQTWFQTGGAKGTFTYDPSTLILKATHSQFYLPTTGAVRLASGNYAAADFSYQDIKYSFNPVPDSATKTESWTVSITQDQMRWAYPKSGTDGTTWVSQYAANTSTTTGANTNTDVNTYTETWVIKAASVSETTSNVDTNTPSGSTATVTTKNTDNEYSVTRFFVNGQKTGTMAFSDAWKQSNSVAFELAQTSYAEVGYQGATAPAAPTVSPATGTGVTGTRYTMPWYFINDNPSTVVDAFTNMGSFIVWTSPWTSSRNLATR
jgi:hypothetical protein